MPLNQVKLQKRKLWENASYQCVALVHAHFIGFKHGAHVPTLLIDEYQMYFVRKFYQKYDIDR